MAMDMDNFNLIPWDTEDYLIAADWHEEQGYLLSNSIRNKVLPFELSYPEEGDDFAEGYGIGWGDGYGGCDVNYGYGYGSGDGNGYGLGYGDGDSKDCGDCSGFGDDQRT